MTVNQIKFIKKLHQKKYRFEEKMYFVEGKKLVEEALENCPEKIEVIYTTESENLYPENLTVEKISAKDMSRISALKSSSPFLAILKMTESPNLKAERTIYLENIKDPGNFGTIVRTADWFNLDAVYFSPECVDVYNPKVIQSTMGSFFRVPLIELKPEHLPSLELPLIGAALNGENLNSSKFSEKYCLVIGSESHGLSDEVMKLLDTKVKIPGTGKAESLNASIAAGILMYALNHS
ncbi:MAG: RNA methyltransferase [Crocinitomicaceae bacterium]